MLERRRRRRACCWQQQEICSSLPPPITFSISHHSHSATSVWDAGIGEGVGCRYSQAVVVVTLLSTLQPHLVNTPSLPPPSNSQTDLSLTNGGQTDRRMGGRTEWEGGDRRRRRPRAFSSLCRPRRFLLRSLQSRGSPDDRPRPPPPARRPRPQRLLSRSRTDGRTESSSLGWTCRACPDGFQSVFRVQVGVTSSKG